MNPCWCWDLEKTFPQYGDFKVAENILHLVNNQGMVWMGMFFSPGLVVLNVIKLYVMMYLRAWAVLTCNVPHEVIFRASRSNNFYYALLLMMLFLCVLPVGFAIVWIEPSWHCGPFSGYSKIFKILIEELKQVVPISLHMALDYMASPGIVIPLLLLLILIIYYLVSLTAALREANNDLKARLRRERTVERRRVFQMADRRRRGVTSDVDPGPFTKWNKLMATLQHKRSIDANWKQESEDNADVSRKGEKLEQQTKDFFTRLVRKTIKQKPTPEDQVTDNEHDSLPYDSNTRSSNPQIHKPVKKSISNSSPNDFTMLVHKVFSFKKSDSSSSKIEVSAPASPSWCQEIPVITISKTVSSEDVLSENNGETKIEVTKFKPKVKCALQKQTTEMDEKVICHFDKDFKRFKVENDIIEAVSKEVIQADLEQSGSAKNE